MAANNKKETAAANGKIAVAMEEFTKKYPDWVSMLDRYVVQPDADIPEEMEPTAKAFSKLLSEVCAEIKNGAIEEAELFKLFPQKFHSAIQELSEPYLRVFHAFVPLRNVYGESPSKAENLIDQIWQQYVIRFSPYRKIERPNGMTDEDMSNLENALDAFAEYCVVRMLHYDAVVQRIKLEANLPDGLCAYIARKVDKDYHELRMNYIISKLEHLSAQEDALDE